jgi:hypothetical protein
VLGRSFSEVIIKTFGGGSSLEYDLEGRSEGKHDDLYGGEEGEGGDIREPE